MPNRGREVKTVDFIKKIKEKVENAKKEAIAQMKYSAEDAIEEHQKTAEKYVCCICCCIIEDLTMCDGCQNIFCLGCIQKCEKRSEREGVACPMCKSRYTESNKTRLLIQIQNQLKFKCKVQGCGEVFEFENREQHLHDLMIIKCPFDCSKFKPCPSAELLKHVETECDGKELHCKNEDCGINVFKEYNTSEPLHPSGQHQCLRDSRQLRDRQEKKCAEQQGTIEENSKQISELQDSVKNLKKELDEIKAATRI